MTAFRTRSRGLLSRLERSADTLDRPRWSTRLRQLAIRIRPPPLSATRQAPGAAANTIADPHVRSVSWLARTLQDLDTVARIAGPARHGDDTQPLTDALAVALHTSAAAWHGTGAADLAPLRRRADAPPPAVQGIVALVLDDLATLERLRRAASRTGRF